MNFYSSGVDKVFGSCGEDGIRIWSDIDQQVLHIPGPPHAQTNCILFTKDGKSILSGWSDGCLRSHTPQSGKLMYSIQVRKVEKRKCIGRTIWGDTSEFHLGCSCEGRDVHCTFEAILDDGRQRRSNTYLASQFLQSQLQTQAFDHHQRTHWGSGLLTRFQWRNGGHFCQFGRFLHYLEHFQVNYTYLGSKYI